MDNGGSLLSQQKLAEVEGDRQRLETLAAKRRDLQLAIEECSTKEACWLSTTTTSSSFFRFKGGVARDLLQEQLKEVEEELLKLCEKMNKIMEES